MDKNGKCGCGCASCPKGCGHCCAKGALIVAGIIFLIVALIHLYRIFYVFPVVIGTVVVGPQASIIALIVLGLLSIWMFWSAAKISRHCCSKDKDTCGPRNGSRNP